MLVIFPLSTMIGACEVKVYIILLLIHVKKGTYMFVTIFHVIYPFFHAKKKLVISRKTYFCMQYICIYATTVRVCVFTCLLHSSASL